MAFDKAKLMRNADKWLAQGNIKGALEEYQKIIDKDPKDSVTLNTMGDLYLRISETEKAISCFTAAAENYEKQGFTKKAIAIYQKILRNKPESIEVCLRLAHLYEYEKSFAEARQYYTKVAEQYKKAGRKDKALEIWKKIAEIDPHSAEVYLKIGETCLQEGQKDEAIKAFIDAGHKFFLREKFDQATQAYRKAYDIDPDNLIALSSLIRAQIKNGYADEAVNLLEEALNKQPYNREFWALLLDCHLELGNPFQAEKAVIKLTEQEPANYPRFLDVARLYLKTSDLVGAVRVLSMVSEHLLLSGQSAEFLNWIEQILAKDPEQIDALKLLVRYYSYLQDERETQNTLERLAEAARLNNNIEEEKAALIQLLKIAPYEVRYSARLNEISNETPMSEAVPARTEAISAEDFDASALHPESAMIEKGFNFVESANTNLPSFNQSLENFQTNGNSDVIESEQLFKASYETGKDETLMENGHSEIYVESPDRSYASDLKREEELQKALRARLSDELEAVRKYRELGGYDLALKALASLEAEFGNVEEIVNLRTEIEREATASLQSSRKEEPAKKETKTPKNSKKVDTSELFSDILEELGLEQEEVDVTGDYDTHYQMGIAYKEMGLIEDAISEFQEAVKLASPDDGTKRYFYCCNMLGICFMEKQLPNIALMWYQRAMQTLGLEEEELQGLRYEIANAYEMSGEKDRALEFFEQIYAIDVNYRDVGQRLAQLQAFRQSDQEGNYSF